MRLLFVTPDLSWPPLDGRSLRTFNTIKLAASRHEVHVATFNQTRGSRRRERERDAIRELSKYCASVEVFPHCVLDRPVGWLGVGLRSMVRSVPVTSTFYQHPKFIEYLASATGWVELLHVDSTDLAWVRTILGAVPAVLVHHNVESDLMEQRAGLERDRIRSWVMAREARLLRRTERWAATRYHRHVVCSELDRTRLGVVVEHERIVVVPNGVDLEYFAPPDDGGVPRSGLVHIGGLNWAPNADGIRFFLRDVWPVLRARHADLSLKLVGDPGSLRSLASTLPSGVDLVGQVPDVRPFAASSQVFVVPLRVGGGTRLKILDAFAMGIPVVSTAAGCEGLPVVSGQHLLVANDAAGFADSVSSILDDPVSGRNLAVAARALVTEAFSWSSIGAAQENAYAGAVEQARMDRG